MVEIVRIENKQELNGDARVGPPFEIMLEKPKELHLHREILALLQEERERMLKTDYGKQFDSVTFSFKGKSDIPIEILASWILRNHKVILHVYWTGKSGPYAAPKGIQVDSVQSDVRDDFHKDDEDKDLHPDTSTVSLKLITIEQAEKCAKQLVDIYHARFCLHNKNDFEHANAILLKKASQGRKRTDLEILVLKECEDKIKREIRNLAKRSDASETKLTEVAGNHRRNMLSYVVSSEPYEKWYKDVGFYIENVATTKIRHLTAYDLSNEQKEGELLPLYPKGWFDRHVFRHLENIHSENVGSAPEDIKNICGRNDRDIHTELQEKNRYNSHTVAKAQETNNNLREKQKQTIHELTLKFYKKEALEITNLKEENKRLKNFIEGIQQNHPCSLNESQSGYGTIQEIERPHTVRTTQDPDKKIHNVAQEKEKINYAQKKVHIKATKRQQHQNPKEHENPYKRCYINTRRR